jgi:hypothetical protein
MSADSAVFCTPHTDLLCHAAVAVLDPYAARCLVDRPARPLPSRFWAAGLSFAPAAWLLEVPYCPHLPHLFFGEEMYQLARMWTRGWEVFAPSTPIAFHQWERSARPSSYQASIQVGGVACVTCVHRWLCAC